MSISDVEALIPQMIHLLIDGQIHHISELRDALAEQFGLNGEERLRMVPSGKSRLFDNRVAWARTDLGQTRLVEGLARGSVRITERGRLLLAEGLAKLTRNSLARYPEFAAFRRRVRKVRSVKTDAAPVAPSSDFGDLTDVLSAETEEELPLGVPTDRRRVNTDKLDKPVDTLHSSMERGKLVLQPTFQRYFVWDDSTASRLIESLLLEIPIPVIYVAEIDG